MTNQRIRESAEGRLLAWFRDVCHFNYMGEGFLALVFGYFTNPWAWTYFVFILTLFTLCQRDDDRLCAEKDGADKWAEYQARVKYRIFPGVY